MPRDRRYEDEPAARRERFGYTAQREADRRVAIRQRASDLKRALMHSTMLITGRQRAAGNKVVRNHPHRAGGSFLRFCAVLLAGASSMLIPIPGTLSLHGPLLGAAEPSTPNPDARPVPPHVVVKALPAQCAQLGYDEPASATVEAPWREGTQLLFEARIVRLVPNAAAAGSERACDIELELQAPSTLPPGAAVSVQLPTQPRSWLLALMDQATGKGDLGQRSKALGTQLVHAYDYAEAQAKDFSQNTELGRNLKASIKDVLKPEDTESEE